LATEQLRSHATKQKAIELVEFEIKKRVKAEEKRSAAEKRVLAIQKECEQECTLCKIAEKKVSSLIISLYNSFIYFTSLHSIIIL